VRDRLAPATAARGHADARTGSRRMLAEMVARSFVGQPCIKAMYVFFTSRFANCAASCGEHRHFGHDDEPAGFFVQR